METFHNIESRPVAVDIVAMAAAAAVQSEETLQKRSRRRNLLLD